MKIFRCLENVKCKCITKTCPCIKQSFVKIDRQISEKIGIFLIVAQNMDCGYTLDEYSQSMLWSKLKTNR